HLDVDDVLVPELLGLGELHHPLHDGVVVLELVQLDEALAVDVLRQLEGSCGCRSGHVRTCVRRLGAKGSEELLSGALRYWTAGRGVARGVPLPERLRSPGLLVKHWRTSRPSLSICAIHRAASRARPRG